MKEIQRAGKSRNLGIRKLNRKAPIEERTVAVNSAIDASNSFYLKRFLRLFFNFSAGLTKCLMTWIALEERKVYYYNIDSFCRGTLCPLHQLQEPFYQEPQGKVL